ncbi:MAG: protein translocase subunit SecF [bacterium]|nr:protein translocase subunit SecF [bacterium]
MYRIVQKRNYLFGLSLVLLAPGIIGLVMWGLRLGIDFTGGSLIRLNFSGTPPAAQIVQEAATAAGLPTLLIQETGVNGLTVRAEALSNDQRSNFLEQLTAKDPSTVQESFESIGPTIGNELKRKAVTATAIVLLIIVLYITWAFRRVSSGPVPSWVYGVCAIIALVHDLFMVVGVFAILGHFFGIEIDALFVTALLTVLGFSVHDTIVVYDRIRERLISAAGKTFEDVVNESLNQTMIRSINTSMTALLILTALFLFGGETIRNFVLALLIGIASGTYSSIFVATPLLVVWHNWKLKKRAA